MCLAEFGMWYDTDKSRRDNQVDNDQLPTNTVAEEAIQVDIQSEQNFEKIITLEGLGKNEKALFTGSGPIPSVFSVCKPRLTLLQPHASFYALV